MRENYLTVKGYGESEIVISKSRFLTYIERAETEEDAISFIDGIKNCIIMQHITALHILLESMIIFKRQMMMGNLVVLQASLC